MHILTGDISLKICMKGVIMKKKVTYSQDENGNLVETTEIDIRSGVHDVIGSIGGLFMFGVTVVAGGPVFAEALKPVGKMAPVAAKAATGLAGIAADYYTKKAIVGELDEIRELQEEIFKKGVTPEEVQKKTEEVAKEMETAEEANNTKTKYNTVRQAKK